MSVKQYLFLFLFLNTQFFNLNITTLIAQDSYTPKFENPFNESWRWHTYPELLGKGCRVIAEEKNGNIWFGITGGVLRYDGLKWDYFQIGKDSSNIPIVSLLVAQNGTIYAASSDGISKYNGVSWNIISLNLEYGDPIEYPYNKIPMFESADHSIWIGSKQGALRIRDGKIFLYRNDKIFNHNEILHLDLDNLKPFDIYSINQDREGYIWFGLRNGEIFKISYNDISDNVSPQWKRIDLQDKYLKIKYPQIEFDGQGNTYVASGANNGGLNIYNGSRWSQTKFKEKYQVDDNFTDIIELHNGKIVVAGIGRIYIGDLNGWQMYENPNAPFASNRLILYQSTSEDLWILGLNNEVWTIDLSSDNWTTLLGLNFQTEDRDGNQWFTSYDSKIVRLNITSKKWSEFNSKHGVIDSPVRLFTSNDGIIWVAGSDNKIAATAYYDGRNWIKQTHPTLGWSIDRRATFEAEDGSLWFGSCTDVITAKGQKGGLVSYTNFNRISGEIKYEYHHPNETFRLISIYGFGETKGKIWAGQLGFYNYDLSDHIWRKVVDHRGLDKSFIDCLDSTPNGDLWVGTRTEGVFWRNIKNEEWRQFTTANGLSSNTIITIYVEDDNNIWVATDKDISHFDGKSWTQNVFTGNFKSNRDGISINRTKDGGLWINQNPPIWYRKALYNEALPQNLESSFKTIKYHQDKIAPETEITFSQERISDPGNVILSWTGNDPWKSTSNSNLKYSYRIDTNGWSEFTSETSNIFLELEAGEHSFQVRARDLDFNVDETPAQVTFYVEPPIWLQSWFILQIFFFLATITFFMIYLYHRNSIIKEISETKARLFENISHELKTPLTLILGSLEKVLKYPLLNEEVIEPLNRANRNSHRLLRLVNQVLDFRKMEAGQLKFKPKKGDIISFLREEVAVFEEAVKSKNINLTYNSTIEELVIWFDPDKIEKIIFNILSNGLKYTPADGSIDVKVLIKDSNKVRTITPVKSHNIKFNRWIQIYIKDTGIGISKRNLEKVFKRFYQAKENSKAAVGGTGIGLSVAKEMARVHFGKIDVQSEEGKGTTFILQIPLIEETQLLLADIEEKIEISDYLKTKYPEREDDEKMLKIEDEDSQKEKMDKILVVEDNVDMREFIKDELKNEYRVFEACNGEQGFNEALKINPELILSDIMMPNIDGIEFCGKIKSDERTSHISVILLTAKTSQESKIEGLETGADDYLTKPFYADELRLRIKNIINFRKEYREKFGKSLELEPSKISITSVDEKFVKKAIAIIEENISDPDFNVEKFSRLIGMSRVGLYSKLKSISNYSVQEFIYLIKLKRAAQLLSESGMSVTEITFEIGLKNLSHFSKLFKDHYGKSPKAYMNEHAIKKAK